LDCRRFWHAKERAIIRRTRQGSHKSIVLVNHTPSPEPKHPTALEDAYASTKWIAEKRPNPQFKFITVVWQWRETKCRWEQDNSDCAHIQITRRAANYLLSSAFIPSYRCQLCYISQATIATKLKISSALTANYSQLPSQSPPCLQNALTPSPNMLPATGATIIAEPCGSFKCSIMYDTTDMPVALFSASTFL
jgi:hypothetical protein